MWESNWSTDLPAGCVLGVLSEHTRTVAGDVAACVCGRVTVVLVYPLGVY